MEPSVNQRVKVSSTAAGLASSASTESNNFCPFFNVAALLMLEREETLLEGVLEQCRKLMQKAGQQVLEVSTEVDDVL